MTDYTRAACATTPNPEIFYPSTAAKASPAEAKAICADCAIRNQCLDDHLHEPSGIWGGTTARERKQLRNGQPLKSSAADCAAEPATPGLPGTQIEAAAC